VHLWYGRHDTSPVHSPDLGESLAYRIPGAMRTVVEKAKSKPPRMLFSGR
jgi:hypothetical protein